MQLQPPNHISEVYAPDLRAQLLQINELIASGYTHVAVDTEFPGMLHRARYEDRSAASLYGVMRSNVDKLKPIQFGISFADKEGNRPPGVSTWQFNMRFDASSDAFDPRGMEMLRAARIELDKHCALGIELADFASAVKASGLYANAGLTWLSFHGGYDFGYWVKALTLAPLPETLHGFNEIRRALCPVMYDVKMLIQSNESIMNYSLGKLAKVFGIEERGTLHQAGTDAHVTCELYFKVRKHLLGGKTKKFENKLFGLSKIFSLGSVEYETNPKKSLLDALNVKKVAMSGSKASSTPMMYPVLLVPAYVPMDAPQGPDVRLLKRGGRAAYGRSFHQL